MFEIEHVKDSETSEEGHDGLSSPMASSSTGEIPPAWNAFIHVLDEVGQNEEASNERTVGCLLTAFRQLCPLAFCAYSNPTEAQGWTECTNDGCRVQYFDRNWTKQATKGVLKITLDKAQNVPKADYFSQSDSYIVFSTQASRVASEIKQNNRDPEWNSTLLLLIKNDLETEGADSKLNLQLFDSDAKKYKPEERAARQTLRKDDFLGSISIDLNEILIFGEKKDWNPTIELKKTGQSNQDTVVQFSTEYIRFDQALMENPEKLKAFNFWEMQDLDSEDGSRWVQWNVINESNNNHGFKPVGYVNAVTTGTQAWIFACESIKTVAVVFRGTEKRRCKDYLTVFQFRSSKLSLEKIEACNLELTTAAQDDTIRVHRGFKGAYKSIRKAVWQLVHGITSWSKDWRICLTGHSLGGALAALCAFDYANTRDEDANGPKIFMMNFGCPRIGNERFQELYDKTVEHSCRVVIGRDIVSVLPPCFGHVGCELRFKKHSEVLWRGASVKEIEVDVPDKLNDSGGRARERWQNGIKSVTTFNRCKLLLEKWSCKRATGDVLRLKRVFNFAMRGRRIRKELVASRKPTNARHAMRMVTTAIRLKDIVSEKDKSKKDTSQVPECVKNHTEKSYQRLAKMYTHGGAKSRDLFAWSVDMHTCEGFRRMFDSAREFLDRCSDKRSRHSAQHKTMTPSSSS